MTRSGVAVRAALLAALLAIGVPVGTGAGTSPETSAGPGTVDPYATVRGMTISCHGSGRVWGSDAMVETMAELKAMGVNWVAIHPYAGIRANGTVGGSRIDRMYRDTEWLTRPIREAHRLGLKIMIKPHIAYWGSSFAWRGAIAFDTDAEYTRFFETYERWISMVAELSADADAFVVGTELDGTTHHEAEWRRIIAAVRSRIEAPLTYAANWDRFESVPFWDALDVIGIQSYFPLVDHTGVPTAEELDGAWARLVDRLEAFGKRHGRRVVLAELGYNRSSWAAREPWDARQGGDHAEQIQILCMTAALRALEDAEGLSGAFLWKWFPGRRQRGNFLMMAPAMRQVIAEQWHGDAETVP